MEEIVSKLVEEIREGDSVLDVGCGDGSVIKELSKRIKIKIRGTDPFPGMWNCYNFLAEEIEEIGEKFDVVYLIKSFHHIQNPGLFLKGARKVLEKGGKLIIFDWKYGTDTGVKEKYYKIEEVEKMLGENEFNVIKKKEERETFYIVAIV